MQDVPTHVVASDRAATTGDAASFTLAQRIARVGLTVFAIVSASALFAWQIQATLQ